MGLINFKDIDFNKSIDKTNKVINFNGNEIQIVNYLSASDKYDFIMSVVFKSLDRDNIFDSFRADIYFDLNIIYLYTNIVFSAEDRVDEFSLYDTLKRSGLIDAVKAEIDEKELELLRNHIFQTQSRVVSYNRTITATVNGFIKTLPEKFEEVKKLINGFDLEKIVALKDIANQFKTVNN